MSLRRLIVSALMVIATASGATAQTDPVPFSQWLEGVRAEAVSKNIPDNVARAALGNIEYDESVIALDQKQPEDKATFRQYVHNTVNAKRIAKGREIMAANRTLLKQISSYYHVQPQFIVALWGIESDFGKHQGNYNIVQSLATLAYEGRRADFFRGELLKALQIIAAYHMGPTDLTGSWAGAMGNCQFMPSSYLNFATDWDKDGEPNIWNSTPDTFASIANYLHQSGWDDQVSWGEGAPPNDSREIVTPGTEEEGLFAVTGNYHVLLKWNRSRMFAVSVGLLADELARQ